jgi:GxxExxY protein
LPLSDFIRNIRAIRVLVSVNEKGGSMLHKDLTDKIICAFYNVYNTLGHGFLEKVYENALILELKKCNLAVTKQQAVEVYYEGVVIGNFYADIVVNGLVILELKTPKH